MSRQPPTLSQWHWYPLTACNLDHVAEISGVYLLADPPPTRPTVFHVGQADNVADRLRQQLIAPETGELARRLSTGSPFFCYKAVHGGEAARLKAERRLIRRYHLEDGT